MFVLTKVPSSIDNDFTIPVSSSIGQAQDWRAQDALGAESRVLGGWGVAGVAWDADVVVMCHGFLETPSHRIMQIVVCMYVYTLYIYICIILLCVYIYIHIYVSIV